MPTHLKRLAYPEKSIEVNLQMQIMQAKLFALTLIFLVIANSLALPHLERRSSDEEIDGCRVRKIAVKAGRAIDRALSCKKRGHVGDSSSRQAYRHKDDPSKLWYLSADGR